MLEQWGLILSVTTVSITMLMIVGAFFAVLAEAQQYYGQSRTMVLLLSNCFNIFYIIISPLIFNLLSKYYVKGVLISTCATAIAAVGRFAAGENYNICLFMTIIVAVAHIPIITAPYGLLKLFPDYQRAYAASIPLFLPVLGINFCILYGMAFIAGSGTTKSIQTTHDEISKLNAIIAVVGVVSAVFTITLMLRLRRKIETEEQVANNKQQVEIKNIDEEASSTAVDQSRDETFSENLNHLKATLRIFSSQKRTTIILIAWGSIVGVNWTYGSLFGIIFANQGLSESAEKRLTEKDIALIGLAANLSSAVFSNLGSYIKNHSKLQNNKIIHALNVAGLVAAIIIQLSRVLPLFQNLAFLIFVIIVLRAGFSSFVSLAFVEMEKEKMSSLVISGFFFWVANVVNLIGMELVDIMPTDLSLTILTAIIVGCIYCVKKINLGQACQI